MRLYSGTSKDFIQQTTQNKITELLRESFRTFLRYDAPESEIRAWNNSLRAMKDAVQDAKLLDHGVLIEYQLPMTSRRLDFMICGEDELKTENAVIVELKQWEKCKESEQKSCIVTWLNEANREILHPSVQVGQYAQYLQDSHTAFYESKPPIMLSACAYLHNYVATTGDALRSSKFAPVLETYPAFTSDNFEELKTFLQSRLSRGKGQPILKKVEQSKYKPSKQLLDHISNVVKGLPDYILLDEQLIAFDAVCSAAEKALKGKQKEVILVRGGPGTGKSVIALNLMGKLSADGFNTHYVTGSRSFTATLREILGSRGANQVKNFSSYMTAESKSVDVLICDEAHRMWEKSKNRFISKSKQSGKLQIEELLQTGRVSVFFIDDKQVVRPEEIGSSDYVTKASKKLGWQVKDYSLTAQFRCMGSDAFINWVTNTLGVEETPEVVWHLDQAFDFKIVGSPQELENMIKAKAEAKNKARLVAGFCWPWSDPNEDGNLVDDVSIDGYQRPWNAKPDKGRLAAQIPPANVWAYDPRGTGQIGCIYTAQGFEFDYVGVIFGRDLVYREGQGWIGNSEESYDGVVKRSKEKFVDLVKNTYRVLLTRGIKGCYVHFLDKETEDYFESRTKSGRPEELV
jgi:hypothetical protein